MSEEKSGEGFKNTQGGTDSIILEEEVSLVDYRMYRISFEYMILVLFCIFQLYHNLRS